MGFSDGSTIFQYLFLSLLRVGEHQKDFDLIVMWHPWYIYEECHQLCICYLVIFVGKFLFGLERWSFFLTISSLSRKSDSGLHFRLEILFIFKILQYKSNFRRGVWEDSIIMLIKSFSPITLWVGEFQIGFMWKVISMIRNHMILFFHKLPTWITVAGMYDNLLILNLFVNTVNLCVYSG